VQAKAEIMEKVKFINHKNKDILFIDLSGSNKERALTTIKKSKAIIRKQPERSLLALTDIRNDSMFIPDLFQAMKEFTRHNKPYVKASAVIVAGELLKLFVDTMSKLSERQFSIFEDIEKAKDWLVEVEKEVPCAHYKGI